MIGNLYAEVKIWDEINLVGKRVTLSRRETAALLKWANDPGVVLVARDAGRPEEQKGEE